MKSKTQKAFREKWGMFEKGRMKANIWCGKESFKKKRSRPLTPYSVLVTLHEDFRSYFKAKGMKAATVKHYLFLM